MTITVTFDPPLPSDSPSTFNTKAFTLLGDLNDWSAEANALAVAVDQDEAALAAAVSAASGSASAASGSASAASGSASAASGSASAASASAGTATTQAGIATTKAGEANTSAINASASLAAMNLSAIDINGGTIDGTVIGGAVPAAGSFTALSASGALTTAGIKEDAAGNLGIGVVPSAWGITDHGAFQGWSFAIYADAGRDTTTYATNSYQSAAGVDRYLASAPAVKYQQYAGQHKWLSASSGTADQPISFVQAMTLDASGNLLVGTTVASGVLLGGHNAIYNSGATYLNTGHVTGTVSGTVYAQYCYNGVGIGSITQSGTTAVLYNTSSDQRLKENIVDAPAASDLIDAIQVRSFDWLSDGSHQRYGMVAQELFEVAPEAVHKPQDPEEMMAVDYSKLVPMLVKEVQSLRARVALLEGI